MRSWTLPRAPPKTSASAMVVSVKRAPSRTMATSTTSAASMEKPIKTQRTRCGEAESAKSEKAAPSLVQWVMRRMRGMTGMAPPSCMCFATQILVNRSARTMTAEIASSHGRRRGMDRLTGRAPLANGGWGSWYPTLAAKTRTRRGWGTQLCISLGGLRLGRVDAHFGERGLAARADVLPDAIAGNFRHVVPAARAFVAGGE